MIAIATTDWEWFERLRDSRAIGKVNFWTPTPWNLKQLKTGEKLYFLLKSPIRKIGGYGTLHHYENTDIAEAWKKYGVCNGVANLLDFKIKTSDYKRKNSKTYIGLEENPVVGCIVLENPVFFEDKDFFDPNQYGFLFPKEIVKIKYFEGDFDFELLKSMDYTLHNNFSLVDGLKEYRVTKAAERRGQAQFRKEVLKKYNYTCAITGETCIDVLEAAHVQPYINERSNNLTNGICLRSDVHILFDCGLITVLQDYTIKTSNELKGTNYMSLEGKKLRLPKDNIFFPSQISLAYHEKFCFRR